MSKHFLCDACSRHTLKTYMMKGNNILYLMGIPKNTLRQMPIHELEEVYKIARDGHRVCEDCKQVCLKHGDCNKTQLHALRTKPDIGAIALRMMRDKATMEDVENEFVRRINLQKAAR